MISTSHKHKIPRTHSYIIGAQLISEHLTGVPQYEALSISFLDFTVHDSIQNKLKGSPSPYRLFSANYRRVIPKHGSSKKMIQNGHHDEKWDLSVYALPREFKYKARKLFLSEGMPIIKKWLSAKRSKNWQDGHKGCTIYYFATDEKIEAKEYNSKPYWG